MEAEWQADRSLLRDLIRTRPDLSLKQIAAQIGRSYSWAKKWAKRLAAAPPEDLEVLHSHSRARVLLSDMVDKWTSPFQTHFGPVFGDEAVQRGLHFPV